jgi:serine/threonine protein kinase
MRFSKTLNAIEMVNSNITYSLVTEEYREGVISPRILGEGKFAKVIEATQQCHGQVLTRVAIKTLHARVDLTAEVLLGMEIKVLAELTKDDTAHFVTTVDILQLGPLFMSACGRLFHPICPRKGCGKKLARSNRPANTNFPRLACPDLTCDYEVSAEHIDSGQRELFQHPSNPHCPHGEEMPTGTIINFVDRPVIVMEKLGRSLDEFFDATRRRTLEQERDAGSWSGDPKVFLMLQRKVALLHKMDLMIQLAEAVERLHSKYDLIHRDLAPDNVMVQIADDLEEDEEVFVLGDHDLFNTRCPWRVKLIDFGLAEEGEAKEMLPWYARGDVNTQANKWPYMSPEAQQREEDLRAFSAVNFSADTLVLPEELGGGDLAPKRGDIIADKNFHDPDCEYKIVDIQSNETGQTVAVLDRALSHRLSDRALHLIRRLGRAHDVYSIGAMFYYILTGAHKRTRLLSSFVVGFQDNPLEFEPSALSSHPNYPGLREAVPAAQRWADQLMILILRAMVRGQKGSFVSSRTDASSDGIRHFREELTRLYHLIQREVVALPVHREYMRRIAQMQAQTKEQTAESKQTSASEVRALKWFASGMAALCGLSLMLVVYVQFMK